MALSVTRTGRRMLPPRLLLYGPHKVGKSTFAANIPGAVFLPLEEGLDALDVPAFWQEEPGRRAHNLGMVMDALASLEHEEHDYQAVVLDTVDWLEPLIWQDVCKREGKASIEDFGYGKGYLKAIASWESLLHQLDVLRGKGMACVLIGHAEIKRYDSPDVEPYDRWQPKLNKSAWALLAEWSDVIGYADFETKARKVGESFGSPHRLGFATGHRVLRLADSAGCVCGNRYGLPAEIPFSWSDFSQAFASVSLQSELEPASNG